MYTYFTKFYEDKTTFNNLKIKFLQIFNIELFQSLLVLNMEWG